MIGLLRSWKLWMALALAAGVIGAGVYGLRQARTIGALEADIKASHAVIEGLGYQLNQQQRQHETALAARDAALEAERAHALDAQNRAASLSNEINQARATDDQIDTCMGLPLPTSVVERLRQ
jgi:hypothetical protein